MFGATLVERKGCEILLKAVADLFKKYDNIEIIIAGGGPLLDSLKELSVKLGIDSITDFKGTVSHSEILW